MNMRIVEQFPREIQMFDDVSIPLSDGTKLAARIWRPVDAEADPVPAILEYLPIAGGRHAERDFTTHPYFPAMAPRSGSTSAAPATVGDPGRISEAGAG